ALTVDPNVPQAAPSDFERHVTDSFAELLLPILGQDGRHPALGRLELSLAVSREHDEGVTGNATTPKFGLIWAPLPALTVRTTGTQSMRAPTLPDLDESNNGSLVLALPDRTAPSGVTQTLLWFGNNRDLRDEHGRAWTLNTELTLPSRPKTSV